MKEWKPNEAILSRTTLKLWIYLQGDHPPGAYTAGDVSSFHQTLKKLSSKYYYNKYHRRIYETEGVLKLIEATSGVAVARMADKTWKSHNSVLNEFFTWCTVKGETLPKRTESICADEFVKIPKSKKTRRGTTVSRRCYQQEEKDSLFSSPKYRGCISKRNWKQAGALVFRDH